MIGYAGFDWVVIDCEHASTSPLGTELEQLVRAAYAADIAPIVRITRNDRGQILKALNFGAKALMIPHVNTAEEAEAAVSAAYYAPKGRRGAAPPVRAARYGFTDWISYYRRSLAEPLIIPIIEEVEGVENIEEIAAVPGIGAIWFGPFDLAVSMGKPEAVYDPSVQVHRQTVYEAARRNGLPVGDLAWDVTSATEMMQEGAQLLPVAVDGVLFGAALVALAAEIGDAKAVTLKGGSE
jgi:2-keto-3-deoxy-L-rhamnonate aldolase RhmA